MRDEMRGGHPSMCAWRGGSGRGVKEGGKIKGEEDERRENKSVTGCPCILYGV